MNFWKLTMEYEYGHSHREWKSLINSPITQREQRIDICHHRQSRLIIHTHFVIHNLSTKVLNFLKSLPLSLWFLRYIRHQHPYQSMIQTSSNLLLIANCRAEPGFRIQPISQHIFNKFKSCIPQLIQIHNNIDSPGTSLINCGTKTVIFGNNNKIDSDTNQECSGRDLHWQVNVFGMNKNSLHFV
jgi:hypothetical protein